MKRLNCLIHVLRTDCGVEYVNMDLFCTQEGVTRQVGEARHQVSNGKTERMHRTVLNMARCMVFAGNLLLLIMGDAVKYSTYILNRSPTRFNASRSLPIEVLPGQLPDLRGMWCLDCSATCIATRARIRCSVAHKWVQF